MYRKKSIKQIICYVLIILFSISGNISFANVSNGIFGTDNQSIYYRDGYSNGSVSDREPGEPGNGDLDLELGKMMDNNAVKNKDSLLKKILIIFNLNTESYQGDQKAIYYIRVLIGYALGIVSFIALCLLLYAFYGVLIGDDKQREKAKGYLKGIAIAIIVMGLSRFIVSMLFRIYTTQAL